MSLVQSIAYILDEGASFHVQTPSFIFNVYNLNSNNLPPELTIQNCLFSLPSFCDLTSNKSCENQEITLKVNCLLKKMCFAINSKLISFIKNDLKHTLMPMATSGHNGNNETLTGNSSQIGLTFYDESYEEIPITKSNKPFDIRIRRDLNMSQFFSYQYVNHTEINENMELNSVFLQNAFNITSNNASIHIEFMPLYSKASYLFVLKLGYLPVINATNTDYTAFKIFCTSKKYKMALFFC
jgi:hypothetical protein